MSENLSETPEKVAATRIVALCGELAVTTATHAGSKPDEKRDYYAVQGEASTIVPIRGIAFGERPIEDETIHYIILHIPGSLSDYSYNTNGSSLWSSMPLFSETAKGLFVASAQQTLEVIDDLRNRDGLIRVE